MKHKKLKNATKMPEYYVWATMKQRCTNPKDISYIHYGGRGIMVCPRWSNSFQLFLVDMGKRPTDKHQIDRIDSQGNYEPGNCRWVTIIEQSDNKERTNKVEFKGKVLTFREIAEITGFKQSTIAYRWYNRLPLDGQLNKPRGYRDNWNKGKQLVSRTRTCEYCKNEYQYKRKPDRFCGYSCSAKWRVINHPHTVGRQRDPKTKQFTSAQLIKDKVITP